jgi:aspartate/tyrosine/aromatic aminotransferase
MGKPDAIFGSIAKFNADKSSRKVNLSICDYRDQDGNPV